MIECKQCGKEFPDTTSLVVCDNCGAVLDRKAEGTTQSPALENIHELSKPPRVLIAPNRSGLSTEDRPGADQIYPQMEMETDDKPLDPDHLDTITAYGKKHSIVTVIGFGASGKTFWINRLRDELPNRFWRCSNLPEEEILISPVGIELTQFVPPTTGGRLSRPYLVVDCAGESFVQALETQRYTEGLKGSSVRPYLVALAFASAYILVIPAEQLLQLSEDLPTNASQADRKQQEINRTIVDGFYKIIAGMIAAREHLVRQGPEDFLRNGISGEELTEIFERRHLRCQQPIYIAFSKADKFIKGAGDDTLDSDPFLFALRYGRKLFNAIHQSFDHYRFDFLSAFYGHDSETRPNYKKDHFGAAEAFLWIHDQVTPPRISPPGKIPTRQTVNLRRIMDPIFRQVWERR